MSHHFETVALLGIGLIGSSISHAVRRGGLARRIVGAAKTEATRATALRLGLVDEAFASSTDAVKEADLVILCVPVRACGPVAAEIAGSLHLSHGTVRNYMAAITRKTGARNRVDAIRISQGEGWV